MKKHKGIILWFAMGAAIIASSLTWMDPNYSEIWLRIGIVSVAAGLILLVARGLGHDVYEWVAHRYPWTARRGLEATLWLSFVILLIAYSPPHDTPAGPVLLYVGPGIFLLALLAPPARTQRAGAGT